MHQNGFLWTELFLTRLKRVLFFATIDTFYTKYVVDFSLRPLRIIFVITCRKCVSDDPFNIYFGKTLIIYLFMYNIITHIPFLLIDKRLRKRKTQKRQVTKKMRLNSQKTKGSRKVKAKTRQTSDESILVVDVPTFRKDEAEESTDLPILSTDEAEESEDLPMMGTDEAEESENLSKMGTDEAQHSVDLTKTATDEAEESTDLPKTATDEAVESEDLPKTSTDEVQQSADLTKMGTDEAEESTDLPKTATDEAQQSADLTKMGTDEAQQSVDLPKTATDESEITSEQSKYISGSDCGTSSSTFLKRMFPCKICGKEFVLEKRLKKHSRQHIGRRLLDERKRKREQAEMEMELTEQEKSKLEEKNTLDDMSSNHNPNTTVCFLYKNLKNDPNIPSNFIVLNHKNR